MSMPGAGPHRGPRGPRRTRFVLAGLLTLALIELVVVVLVSRMVGAPLTLLLLLLLSLSGLLVLRLSGGKALRRLSTAGQGGPYGPELATARDTAWSLLGGLLLAVPGFVTAVPGLLLAVPLTRKLLTPVLDRGTGRLAAKLLGEPLVCRMAGAGPQVVQGDVISGPIVDVRVIDPGASSPPSDPAPKLSDRAQPHRPSGEDPPQPRTDRRPG